MKTRAQQVSKRINMDTTPSTITTPVKQRRLIEQIANTTENTSTHSLNMGNITTGLKSSMIVRKNFCYFIIIKIFLFLDNTIRKTRIT